MGLLLWLHTECGQLKTSTSSSYLPTRHGVSTSSLGVHPLLQAPYFYTLSAVSRWREQGSPGENLWGSMRKKASGTRKAKGKGEGKAEQSTVRLYKLIKSAPLLASARSKAIMTKSHYHTVDVKVALHRCSHQQTKNSLFLVDIWTVQKRNVLREGNLLSNWDPRNQWSPVPSFLLNQQWQSSGWQ